ncbi:MAG: 3-phosphoshikimate 1-carboxyvinyltransferase [Clostridia bacterium]|nr:3-phosphoshikimate 1-carboxyvinyltransferase [Clostridia bacterium]
MSNVTVKSGVLHGSVTVPPSKSDVHRAIICAALSKGTSVISPVAFSQDILATIDCIRALGAEVTVSGDCVTVCGDNTFSNKTALLDCRESGSTVRFFIPVAAAGSIDATFVGKGRLPQRPLGVYTELLPMHGIVCKTEGGLPFSVSGQLTAGQFALAGDISSQFVTGLLFALPLLDGDSVIHLTSMLQSKGYIDMTIDVMRRFGVIVTEKDGDYYIRGGQKYIACKYTTEGDWSQAAFFLTAGALGSEISVNGLDMDSRQGDKKIIDILRRFGANINIEKNTISCHGENLHGIEIDASQIPDLVPILAVCGAFAQGTTRIYNAQRVRLKESDRLSAMKNALASCGADISETHDGLLISGNEKISGGDVDGCNDHRIVMSMSIAALRCENGVNISDKESINKSYAEFFDDFISLGGIVQ